MTLAQQCEAIWPCGWSGWGEDYTRAMVAKRLLEVIVDKREYRAFYPVERLGDADLRALLVAVRAKLVEDLKLPDITEEA